MYNTHEDSFSDPIGEYYTYETVEEAYLIATNNAYGAGVYINEHFPNEFFLKEEYEDGKYEIGFLQGTSSEKTLYVATNDGGMTKDDETWVSNNQAEIYLVNADRSGFRPFELVRTQYDWQINVTLWYRLIEPPKIKSKRGRKKKNVH